MWTNMEDGNILFFDNNLNAQNADHHQMINSHSQKITSTNSTTCNKQNPSQFTVSHIQYVRYNQNVSSNPSTILIANNTPALCTINQHQQQPVAQHRNLDVNNQISNNVQQFVVNPVQSQQQQQTLPPPISIMSSSPRSLLLPATTWNAHGSQSPGSPQSPLSSIGSNILCDNIQKKKFQCKLQYKVEINHNI